MTSEKLDALTSPQLMSYAYGSTVLTCLLAGSLAGWFLRPPEYVERIVPGETVTEYVTVPEPVEVLPLLPECAGFDFDPDVSGMAFTDFIVYTGELYAWGATCSNALNALK